MSSCNMRQRTCGWSVFVKWNKSYERHGLRTYSSYKLVKKKVLLFLWNQWVNSEWENGVSDMTLDQIPSRFWYRSNWKGRKTEGRKQVYYWLWGGSPTHKTQSQPDLCEKSELNWMEMKKGVFVRSGGTQSKVVNPSHKLSAAKSNHGPWFHDCTREKRFASFINH